MHIVTRVQVTGLFIYPIKACRGVALKECQVAERGFAGDRRYMLVDSAGTFITQREVPKLALVELAIEAERLRVSAPGAPTLELPTGLSEGEAVAIQVWDHRGTALRHQAGSRWFSAWLGDIVSLVYMPDSERRAVNPNRGRPDDIVSFADGYPFLLLSEESLADLNARLPEPLSMRRFRPNIVISGCSPYEEDGFSRLLIGGVPFRAVKRCERCVVTTVDPDTGQQGKEPLRTLASYRTQDNLVWFGMNLVHDASGLLCVGDQVTSQLR